METEVAKVVAERQLRRQHIPMPWTRADAADHARWTRHDNEGHEKETGLRYAECPKCWG